MIDPFTIECREYTYSFKISKQKQFILIWFCTLLDQEVECASLFTN